MKKKNPEFEGQGLDAEPKPPSISAKNADAFTMTTMPWWIWTTHMCSVI